MTSTLKTTTTNLLTASYISINILCLPCICAYTHVLQYFFRWYQLSCLCRNTKTTLHLPIVVAWPRRATGACCIPLQRVRSRGALTVALISSIFILKGSGVKCTGARQLLRRRVEILRCKLGLVLCLHKPELPLAPPDGLARLLAQTDLCRARVYCSCVDEYWAAGNEYFKALLHSVNLRQSNSVIYFHGDNYLAILWQE